MSVKSPLRLDMKPEVLTGTSLSKAPNNTQTLREQAGLRSVENCSLEGHSQDPFSHRWAGEH